MPLAYISLLHYLLTGDNASLNPV